VTRAALETETNERPCIVLDSAGSRLVVITVRSDYRVDSIISITAVIRFDRRDGCNCRKEDGKLWKRGSVEGKSFSKLFLSVETG